MALRDVFKTRLIHNVMVGHRVLRESLGLNISTKHILFAPLSPPGGGVGNQTVSFLVMYDFNMGGKGGGVMIKYYLILKFTRARSTRDAES